MCIIEIVLTIMKELFMTIEFDLNRMSDIYLETMNSPEKAVAFDLNYANGRFLFMIFLSDEDEESKDKLFVYMRNTHHLLRLKMYGNHLKGKFLIYFNDDEQNEFINELNLNASDEHSFDFEDFLKHLNANIPDTINRNERKDNLRNNCNIINRISDDERTVFIGPRRLTVGHPQDKTLRKLYLYTDAKAEEIDKLIKYLLKTNTTVAWTTEDNFDEAGDINAFLQQVL